MRMPVSRPFSSVKGVVSTMKSRVTYRRVAAVGCLQLGDGDELALRQLQHVVATVHVDQLIGTDLGHHIAGVVPAFGIEEFGGDLGSLVVARDQIRRLDE